MDIRSDRHSNTDLRSTSMDMGHIHFCSWFVFRGLGSHVFFARGLSFADSGHIWVVLWGIGSHLFFLVVCLRGLGSHLSLLVVCQGLGSHCVCSWFVLRGLGSRLFLLVGCPSGSRVTFVCAHGLSFGVSGHIHFCLWFVLQGLGSHLFLLVVCPSGVGSHSFLLVGL